MKVKTLREMENELVEFAKAHDFDYNLETSPMENNSYHKTYMFADGSVWYEHNDIVVEEIESEVYGIKVKALVRLARTEYWSTDDSTSKYVYRQI